MLYHFVSEMYEEFMSIFLSSETEVFCYHWNICVLSLIKGMPVITGMTVETSLLIYQHTVPMHHNKSEGGLKVNILIFKFQVI